MGGEPGSREAHGQHKQSTGERAVEGSGDRVSKVRDCLLGMAEPPDQIWHT